MDELTTGYACETTLPIPALTGLDVRQLPLTETSALPLTYALVNKTKVLRPRPRPSEVNKGTWRI